MSVNVVAPALWDSNGNFLDNAMVGIDAYAQVGSIVSKPSSLTVPGYAPSSSTDTLEVKDLKANISYFLTITLDAWRELVEAALGSAAPGTSGGDITIGTTTIAGETTPSGLLYGGTPPGGPVVLQSTTISTPTGITLAGKTDLVASAGQFSSTFPEKSGTVAHTSDIPTTSITVASIHLRAQSTGFAVLDLAPTVASACYRIEFSGFVTTTRLNSLTLSYTDQNGVSVTSVLPVLISPSYNTLTVTANWGITGVRFYGYSGIFTATNATHITLTSAVAGATPSYDIDIILTLLP